MTIINPELIDKYISAELPKRDRKEEERKIINLKLKRKYQKQLSMKHFGQHVDGRDGIYATDFECVKRKRFMVLVVLNTSL